ncbi:HAD family hydrolase [Thaumasiovibrio sp. DFM-14]|uniref:HAD family hydrolase n=1 Tax=Thaumasiovibrio sp. DFM-14 TaxID=3384792 RepID=UPI00399EE914
MASALLFDLDGTLLDTAEDMAKAANKVLAQHGFEALSQEQIYANTSFGARGLLSAGFGKHYAEHDAQQLRKQFLLHYAENINSHTRYYPEIENVLNTLCATATPWGIMTNKPGFLTELLLPFFPLLEQANIIVCGDTLPLAKPHPEPLLYCAERIDKPPHEITYVGDVEGDMTAASAAGMSGAIASWGYIGADVKPTSWPHHHLLQTPADILSLLPHTGEYAVNS